ncbi:MAG: c-type cytochrome [Cohaesibacteraceae bacterium]
MKRSIGIAVAAATMMMGGASMASAQDAEVYIAADATAGAAVFRQCGACHMVGPNAMQRVGPPLNGIIGREWASFEGFRYSDSHIEAGETQGGVWTVSIMSEYLQNPRAMVPRTRMAFAGLRQEQQIRDVIKYLAGFDADGNEVDPAPVLTDNYGCM